MKKINIAIDGPAGAGKSSIAREVASQLGFVYVDTGALYRAIALFSTEYPTKKDFLKHLEDDCHLELKYFGGTQCIFLNGENVTESIRTPEVSMKASEVSACRKCGSSCWKPRRTSHGNTTSSWTDGTSAQSFCRTQT